MIRKSLLAFLFLLGALHAQPPREDAPTAAGVSSTGGGITDPKAFRGRLNIQEFRPEDYGAAGDEVTDDFDEIMDCIAAAEEIGGKVVFSSKTYRVVGQLVVASAATLEGSGASPNMGARALTGNNFSDVMPTVAPYVLGSVLLIDSPGVDGIKVTAGGKAVHIRDLAIKFGNGHRFNNTGHGIHFDAPLCPDPDFAGEQDLGVNGGSIERVIVYGHDGNHSAIRVVNAQLCNLTNNMGFSGGGIDWYSNTRGYFGNSTITQNYFCTFLEGAAHGWKFHANPASGNGTILVTLIRPQSFFVSGMTTLEGAANPYDGPDTATQHYYHLDNKCQWITCTAGNWESNGGAYTHVNPTELGTKNWSWENTHYYPAAPGQPARTTSLFQHVLRYESSAYATTGVMANESPNDGAGIRQGYNTGPNSTIAAAWAGSKYVFGEGEVLEWGATGGGDDRDEIPAANMRLGETGRLQVFEAPENEAVFQISRNTTITPASDADLTVPLTTVGAGYTFEIDAWFFVSQTGADQGIRVILGVPANNHLNYTSEFTRHTGYGELDPEVVAHTTVNTETTPVEFTPLPYTGFCRVHVRINGAIAPTAPGNLELKWAQDVSNAAPIVRYPGARIVARRKY